MDPYVEPSGTVYTAGWFAGTADFDPGESAEERTSAGSRDVFIQAMDTSGTFEWVATFGGSGLDMAYSVTGAVGGTVASAGWFADTVDFDPGAGDLSLASAGGGDVYVQSLVLVDSTPPNAIVITPSTIGPISSGDVDFTVVFDEDVQGFDAPLDVTLNQTGTVNDGISISGGPDTYVVTVEGVIGDGSFTLEVNTASDVTDLAGNPLATSVTSAPVEVESPLTPSVPVGAWPAAFVLLGLGILKLVQRKTTRSA